MRQHEVCNVAKFVYGSVVDDLPAFEFAAFRISAHCLDVALYESRHILRVQQITCPFLAQKVDDSCPCDCFRYFFIHPVILL